MKTMMIRLAAACALLPALTMAGAPAALAHRGHDAMSVVRVEADGRVAVSHRFEAHDIEPALAAIAPEAQVSLDDPEAIAALKRYLLRHFTLSVDGEPVMLRYVASDIGASQVRFDLVGTLPEGAKTIEIASTILRDVYPGQVDQAMVHTAKSVRTLRFAGSEIHEVALD